MPLKREWVLGVTSLGEGIKTIADTSSVIERMDK